MERFQLFRGQSKDTASSYGGIVFINDTEAVSCEGLSKDMSGNRYYVRVGPEAKPEHLKQILEFEEYDPGPYPAIQSITPFVYINIGLEP
jgi:hypothetical protein